MIGIELVIFTFVVGLALGFLIGYIVKKPKASAADFDIDKIEILTTENGKLQGRIENAVIEFKKREDQIKRLEEEKEQLIERNAQLKANFENTEQRLKEQKEEIEKLQEKFKLEFENIANKLLKDNSKELAETSQKRLQEILEPFKENIKNFEKKVEDKYEKEQKERISLKEEIKHLTELNQQMSNDAKNLTLALKGDSKKQGNWGELVLERILESSGLIKGEEYDTQVASKNLEGERIQPDVVVNLPDNKHIIIDSKVSLTAYTNYLETENENEKDSFLKQHLQSVKKHIDDLSSKNYAQAIGVNSPDFVLMFMPSEPIFSFTLQNDHNIYNYAWDKKIIIVSPTTLLATLKTIASVWKQERQTKNAIEIARQAGALYDKFVGFLNDMEAIKRGIDQSAKAYESAVNKLKTGRGNLVDATIRIKKLGAKTNKHIPESFKTDEQEDDNNEQPMIE
jgi:DNA recombination protein RmuC